MNPFESHLNLNKIPQELPKWKKLFRCIVGRIIEEWCCYFDRRQERSPLFDNLPEMIELLHDFVINYYLDDSPPPIASPINVSIGIWIIEALQYMIGSEIDEAENMDCMVKIDYSGGEIVHFSEISRRYKIQKLKESSYFTEEKKEEFTKILEDGSREERRKVESIIDKVINIERTKNLKKRRKFLTKSKEKIETISSKEDKVFEKFMNSSADPNKPPRRELVEKSIKDTQSLVKKFKFFHSSFVVPQYVQLNREDDEFERSFWWRRNTIEAVNEIISYLLKTEESQHNMHGVLRIMKELVFHNCLNDRNFIHISHRFQYSKTFWDDFFIRCSFFIFFFSGSHEVGHMFTKMYGSMDHKKDKNRYISLHSMLVRSVDEHSKSFDFNVMKRKLFRLQVIFCYNNYYSTTDFSLRIGGGEDNQIYQFAKEIVEKNLDKEDSNPINNWMVMIELKKRMKQANISSSGRVGILNWMIRMIRNNKDFGNVKDRLKSVDEMSNDEIIIIKEIHIGSRIENYCLDEEFRKRFFQNRAFHCSGCYKMEDLVKKMKVCAGCRINRYCSKKCQKSDWKNHKKTCLGIQKIKKENGKIKKN